MTINRFQIRAIARKLLWIIGYVINDAIITPCRSLYRTYFLPRLIRHPDGQHSLRILHHDAHFMVVDKPANVNIDENKGRPFGRVTVETLIKARFPHYHLRNVHQLDYGTSGVYVIALTPESASIACNAFRVRTVKKTYLAILEGHVAEEEVTITRSIGIDPLDPKRMHLDGLDQKLRVMKRGWIDGHKVTLVELRPRTGRRHQLRMHCLSIGHPIVGDYAYAPHSSLETTRMMLHAFRISFDSFGGERAERVKSMAKGKKNAAFMCRLDRFLAKHASRLSIPSLTPLTVEAPCPFLHLLE